MHTNLYKCLKRFVFRNCVSEITNSKDGCEHQFISCVQVQDLFFHRAFFADFPTSLTCWNRTSGLLYHECVHYIGGQLACFRNTLFEISTSAALFTLFRIWRDIQLKVMDGLTSATKWDYVIYYIGYISMFFFCLKTIATTRRARVQPDVSDRDIQTPLVNS